MYFLNTIINTNAGVGHSIAKFRTKIFKKKISLQTKKIKIKNSKCYQSIRHFNQNSYNKFFFFLTD